MHSPNVFSGPALNMRRASPYGYPEPTSPPCEPPSTKILQSILYNFAHSNYMNSSSRNDHREGRREEQREGRRTERADDRRDPRERTPSRDRHTGHGGNSQHYHQNNLVRNRQHGQEQVSPPDMHPAQREMSYLLPLHQFQNDPQSALSRYYQGPSSTVTTLSRSRESSQPYPDNYLSPRNRSSSIGSAGSSFRDSRSPSHDSTASRDSMSRCSPLSIGSSPSPSPPTQDTGSKLLGILKGGSYNYSYNPLPTKTLQSPLPQGCASATPVRDNSRHNSISETVTSGSLATVPKWEPPSPRSEYIHSNNIERSREKRDIRECQDEPIDLSVKQQKRQRLESADRSTCSPSVDSGWGSDYFAPSSGADDIQSSPSEITPRKSILESILCGRLASVRDHSRSSSNSPIPAPATPSRFEYPYSIVKDDSPPPLRREERSLSYPLSPVHPPESPCSARSLPASMPPSPVPSIGSQISVLSTRSRCPWRQRVTLAKKNLLPVSARVSDWLIKIINFAKSQPEFSGLPETDKVTLMQHCWTRLMLLFMAETNFQFAVTPVHEDVDDGRPPAISGIDPTEPTMDSVELVQNFIKKCQALQIDAEDFKCLKMYTLFHSGCSGLENTDFVDNISSNARQALQDHVRKSRPDDKLRYSDLLLYLHTLFGVNCGMVQTLFCAHVAKNCDIDQHVRNMVLRRDSTDELADDNENRCETTDRMRSKSTD